LRVADCKAIGPIFSLLGPSTRGGQAGAELVLRKSTYRPFFAPLIDYVEHLRDSHPVAPRRELDTGKRTIDVVFEVAPAPR
jgi:hypothetical protein